MKKLIRKLLKSTLDVKYIIRENSNVHKDIEKITFIELIKNLKEVEARTNLLESEAGIDMTMYDNKFFNIIESLLKINFNKEQLALINMYLYHLSPDEEWDGLITVKVDSGEKVFKFKTPEQLWDVVKLFN